MPRRNPLNILTDAAVRREKPGEKARKLVDGGGLHLLLTPAGSRLWRIVYRLGGKPQQLSLGSYPDVPLAQARERAAEIRAKVAAGVDPSLERKREKILRGTWKGGPLPGTLEAVAREFVERKLQHLAEDTRENKLRRLEKFVFPKLGGVQVAKITPQDVLMCLQPIENDGTGEVAHRTRQVLSEVFRYAAACGLVQADPTSLLRGALRPIQKGRHAAIVKPEELPPVLRAFRGYWGHSLNVRVALQLQVMLFCRPGDLARARWAEFAMDGDEPMWEIPGERLKGRLSEALRRAGHLVPLPRQAVALLRQVEQDTKARSEFVFPSARSTKRPMTTDAVLAAIRSLGYDQDTLTSHGFRATARTILEEKFGVSPVVLELQLAHTLKDPNGRAYVRTEHLHERRRVLQMWADYLDELAARAA